MATPKRSGNEPFFPHAGDRGIKYWDWVWVHTPPGGSLKVRALVTDTGWGAAPNEIRTNMAVGNPWWANYFPTTKNPPEAPRYFWRGGQPPP